MIEKTNKSISKKTSDDYMEEHFYLENSICPTCGNHTVFPFGDYMFVCDWCQSMYLKKGKEL